MVAHIWSILNERGKKIIFIILKWSAKNFMMTDPTKKLFPPKEINSVLKGLRLNFESRILTRIPNI